MFCLIDILFFIVGNTQFITVIFYLKCIQIESSALFQRNVCSMCIEEWDRYPLYFKLHVCSVSQAHASVPMWSQRLIHFISCTYFTPPLPCWLVRSRPVHHVQGSESVLQTNAVSCCTLDGLCCIKTNKITSEWHTWTFYCVCRCDGHIRENTCVQKLHVNLPLPQKKSISTHLCSQHHFHEYPFTILYFCPNHLKARVFTPFINFLIILVRDWILL